MSICKKGYNLLLVSFLKIYMSVQMIIYKKILFLTGRTNHINILVVNFKNKKVNLANLYEYEFSQTARS